MFGKPVNEYEDSKFDLGLPKGIRLMEKMEGGGDTLFQSIYFILEEIRESLSTEIPEDHIALRKKAIQHLLENPSKFKLKLDKHNKKLIQAMKNPGVLPREEVLLAVCDLFKITIMVHHGMPSPIVYKCDNSSDEKKIHIQCLAGIHYNPARRISGEYQSVDEKCVNILQNRDESLSESNVSNIVQVNVGTNSSKPETYCNCLHTDIKGDTYVIATNGIEFCALIDTGAQVSLITENVLEKLKERDPYLTVEPCSDSLGGIGNNRESIIGIVKLKLSLFESQHTKVIPFAIVKESCLPSCCILGANFIARNNLIIDFHTKIIYDTVSYGQAKQSRKLKMGDDNNFLGTIKQAEMTENESETQIEDLEEIQSDLESEESEDENVQYNINNNNFQDLQDRDHAITLLKQKVSKQIKTENWSEYPIRQFRRYNGQYKFQSGILYKHNKKQQKSIIVPFKIMVDIVYQTHTKLAHIGRYKLCNTVVKNFWHPALDKLTKDICRSCIHCQIHKPAKNIKEPPMYKITTKHPFKLVAMDLLMLLNSSSQFNTLLVATDHYSKWLNVIPIKDKRSVTVARAVHERILPNLPKIPDRILTDNGPEFRGQEFNDIVNKYNIIHTYSTPYKPSSNGCVERCNQSLIQLLKGVVNENPRSWETNLPKAVMVYNNTIHSETHKSPSEAILHEQHDSPNDKLLIDKNIVSTWKTGHPKYAPYKIGEKVLRKIHKKGSLLSDKLMPKYD